MNKHFMIDIESTGIDPTKEDLLQVGILELDFVHGYWLPGRSFEEIQHTSRQPESEFAKKHMTALYAKCNAAPFIPVNEFRAKILNFFEECGVKTPDAYLMGWNASGFDLPFLAHHGYLKPSSYEIGPNGEDIRVGDYHYRVYELGGSIALAENVTGYERKDLLKYAKQDYPMDLPVGKEHDALYDCYSQTQILNGLITIMGNE